MSQAVISELSKKYLRKTPELKTGYTVRIHQKIKEGDKERIQIFEGLIIKMNGGKGVGGTITVRKITEGIGVEKIFPIHSPNIAKIEVKKIAKVRRSKLYYMRELSGKSARLREKQVNIVSDQQPLYTEEELAAKPETTKQTPEIINETTTKKEETQATEEKAEVTPAEKEAVKKETEEKAEKNAPTETKEEKK